MMSREKNTNPFLMNEEDTSMKYGRMRPQGKIGDACDRPKPYTGMPNSREEHRQNLLQLIDESEDRQTASSRRALESMYESEAIGIATAEELVQQGEQLDNIERKTDTINKIATASQKHINSIKSVFGGIKTWWSGTGKDSNKDADQPTDRPLRAVVDEQKASGVPSQLRRKFDDPNIYDDDLDRKFVVNSRSLTTTNSDEVRLKKVTNSAKEKELDKNLGLMSDGMSRLRSLAMNMGNEIDQQNTQLDRLDKKVLGASENIIDKNQQMTKILKK